MELATGTSIGSLFGLGTQFTDFASITVDPRASWSPTGANKVAAVATLTNDGTLSLTAAALSVLG